MQVYFPDAGKDRIEFQTLSLEFEIVCQAQINFMSECIDYTMFLKSLAEFDKDWQKSLQDNQVNYLKRPHARIVVYDEIGDIRRKIDGHVIKSKKSFQNSRPGYEVTVRVDFSENMKVFNPDASSMTIRQPFKVLYLDLD